MLTHNKLLLCQDLSIHITVVRFYFTLNVTFTYPERDGYTDRNVVHLIHVFLIQVYACAFLTLEGDICQD